jgi:hypothetical protein
MQNFTCARVGGYIHYYKEYGEERRESSTPELACGLLVRDTELHLC